MTARECTDRLAELLRLERHAMADFILALADFDRRKLWLELGHSSLFSFLRRELGLSAGAAQYRKVAAELVQRHAGVEAALRAGKLCLSSVIELAKVLTPENDAEVLPRFFGLSSRDAAAVAASIRPVVNPPVREVVTPLRPAVPVGLPERSSSPSAAAGASLLRAPETPPTDIATGAPTVFPVSPTPRPAVEPLDSERARLHITVSRRFLAKLDTAKAELSHSHPGATSEEALEVALDALLAQRARRKGFVEKPRACRRPAGPDTVPAAVRREVWARSAGGCEWPLESGGACGSALRLQVDHVTPRALGGPSTIDNLRILCAVHNQLAARQVLGDACMDRFTGKAGGAGGQRGRAAPDGRRRRAAGTESGSLFGGSEPMRRP